MAKFTRKKENTYNKVRRFLSDNETLKVGFFDTRYQDGTPVAYVASIHEFGSPSNNIPPRSFMRSTATEKADAWAKAAAQIFRPAMLGSGSMTDALDMLGFIVEGDIAEKITQISAPALKESTIRAKRSKRADGGTTGSLGKPLVETGLMLQSVTHQVN